MKNDYDFYNNIAETTTNERKANHKRTANERNKPFKPESKPQSKNELHYQHECQDCLSHLHKCRIHGCRRYYEVSRISPFHQIWGQGLYGC